MRRRRVFARVHRVLPMRVLHAYARMCDARAYMRSCDERYRVTEAYLEGARAAARLQDIIRLPHYRLIKRAHYRRSSGTIFPAERVH